MWCWVYQLGWGKRFYFMRSWMILIRSRGIVIRSSRCWWSMIRSSNIWYDWIMRTVQCFMLMEFFNMVRMNVWQRLRKIDR